MCLNFWCCVVLRLQVTAAMRLADGVLLVVDVLEGVGAATERAIQQAVQEGLAITMLVSKVRKRFDQRSALHRT
jgi:translation elongation factor EF-G